MMNMSEMTFNDDSFSFTPDQVSSSGEGRLSTGVLDALPPPGYYEIRIVSAGPKRNKDTKEIVVDSEGRPIFTINRIAVTQPAEFEGSYAIWQTLYTTGFFPKNFKTGELIPNAPKDYEFVNMLRAIDATAATTDFNTNVQTLAALLDTHPTLVVRLAYEGLDKTHVTNLLAQGVVTKEAYKQAKLTSPKFKNVDGTYRTETLGLSGDLVQANLVIKDYVRATPDALKKVVLGPLPVKR